jgi:hypothetical protein
MTRMSADPRHYIEPEVDPWAQRMGYEPDKVTFFGTGPDGEVDGSNGYYATNDHGESIQYDLSMENPISVSTITDHPGENLRDFSDNDRGGGDGADFIAGTQQRPSGPAARGELFSGLF